MGKINELETEDKILPYEKSEKWRILKNIMVISIAFMIHFTAFEGASNLQSSINAEAGLGTSSLAAGYAALMISNMFLPSAIIRWLGSKYALILSFVMYMPYIAAQYLPRFYTMIPAGIIMGLGGGPLWVAKCVYITTVAEAFHTITKTSVEVLIIWFFGIFFMVFHLSGVWGNLISSMVLLSGNSTASAVSAINATLIPEVCGIHFVSSKDAAKAITRQPPEKIQMIAGIYLVCMVAAILIVLIGLDPLTRYNAGRKKTASSTTGWSLAIATFRLLKEPNQLLVIPMTIWLGLDMAFVGSDFTAAYLACALGTGKIGYVMILNAICASLTSSVMGTVVKMTGRLPVILVSFLLHLSLYVTLLTWRPHADQIIAFYAISGLWGLCSGVWWIQLNAMCGILFPGREEASYSNFRVWKSIGIVIAYVYSPLLKTYVKLSILLALLLIGMSCYATAEIKLLLKKKRDESSSIQQSGIVNDAFNKIE